MKFRDLNVGDTFDFIDDKHMMLTSFYKRCVKTGPRTYGTVHDEPQDRLDRVVGLSPYRVGSVSAEVFHVRRGDGRLLVPGSDRGRFRGA